MKEYDGDNSRIRERLTFQLRGESTNVLNFVNLNNPAMKELDAFWRNFAVRDVSGKYGSPAIRVNPQ